MSILKNFKTPLSLPKDSPSDLWTLQCLLDRYAQNVFGPRNPQKKLYQPSFNSKAEDQPHVINSKNEDGGWAQLSLNASSYWPTTVYELAHETVHLLDPRPAPPYGKGSNWLEEGIAVEFSLHCAGLIYGNIPPVTDAKYNKARNLTLKIGKANFFERCKGIREECVHFSDATTDAIKRHASECDEAVIKKLIKRFDDTPLINE
ncbi:hypothetical protein KSL88_18750 [Pectobacterium polaris]|uniref:hypothetical protein n=1 Tax=Pectobacterium polaris TaxID=2042057 RepID=UPI001CC3EF9C|nr:hypothetical protein [Pectobacterium polaris]UAY91503.1 hypothetical protein KSL88_18750 [Pectobacterium polaris]